MSELSTRLRAHVAEAAWYALASPASMYQTPTCKRLLGQAAFGHPLSRDAVRTVLSICADVLADADAEAEATDIREAA